MANISFMKTAQLASEPRFDLTPRAAPYANASRSAACGWSIDDEPIGSSGHDSSWMLRKGLDVIEDAPIHDLPVEWRGAWQ